MGVLVDKLIDVYLQEKKERKVEMLNPVRSYPKLDTRLDSLNELSEMAETKAERTSYLMEGQCLCSVMESIPGGSYERILSYVHMLGGKRVVDIGCAYGHQSEVFSGTGVDYMGVTNHEGDFFNQDIYTYMTGHYPCELPTQEGDIGVSVLCMGWNCYLDEGEKTLHEQAQSLSRDFLDCILYIPETSLEIMASYFDTYDKIGNSLYHFSNK
ncbi:hypothetical protein [Rossellomorea marisflavi]|uniref:hypothetical protein n=1 Tax=Rossellomorea marisflavi TaxID=189381 RepID=UPI003F9FA8EC